MSNQTGCYRDYSPNTTFCPPSTHSNYRVLREALHDLDTIDLAELTDPPRAPNLGSVIRYNPTDVQVTQSHPSLSTPTLEHASRKSNGPFIDTFVGRCVGQFAPQHTPSRTPSSLSQDLRFQLGTERSSFENVTIGETLVAGTPILDSGNGLRQNSTVRSDTSTNPHCASSGGNGNAQDTLTSANDEMITNPFRPVTTDNEEEKRRMLGSFLDSEFPEIPDIFMNCQNYIADLEKRAELEQDAGHRLNSEPDSIRDDPSRIDMEGSTDGFRNIVEEARLMSHERNIDMDMLISRSSTPDIVKEFRHIPVSSLNAFIDGDDQIEENYPPMKTGLETSDAPNHHFEMNVTEGHRLVEDHVNVCRRELRRLATDGNEKDDVAMEDYEERFPQNDDEKCVQNDDSELNMLTTRDAFQNLTNLQTSNQDPNLVPDASNSLSNGVSMNDFWRKMVAFNKKIDRHRKSGINGLKYYSIKRMEKDLKGQLNISQTLFAVASELRQERIELVQACEKEKYEIKQLRKKLFGLTTFTE